MLFSDAGSYISRLAETRRSSPEINHTPSHASVPSRGTPPFLATQIAALAIAEEVVDAAGHPYGKGCIFSIAILGVEALGPSLEGFLEQCVREQWPVTLFLRSDHSVSTQKLGLLDPERQTIAIGLSLSGPLFRTSGVVGYSLNRPGGDTSKTSEVIMQLFTRFSSRFEARFQGGLHVEGDAPSWMGTLWNEVGGKYWLRNTPLRGAELPQPFTVLYSDRHEGYSRGKGFKVSLAAALLLRRRIVLAIDGDSMWPASRLVSISQTMRYLIDAGTCLTQISEVASRDADSMKPLEKPSLFANDQSGISAPFPDFQTAFLERCGIQWRSGYQGAASAPIVIGCYVTDDNESFCIDILEFCESVGARPVYLLAQSAVESLACARDTRLFMRIASVLHRLDRELMNRHYPSSLIAPASTFLGRWVNQTHDVLVQSQIYARTLPSPSGLHLDKGIQFTRVEGRATALLDLEPHRASSWSDIANGLDREVFEQCLIRIPFYKVNEPISCLDFQALVKQVKTYCKEKHIRAIGALSLSELNFHSEEAKPAIRELLGKPGDRPPTLSIVVAIYNSAPGLPEFLRSLLAAQGEERAQLVLVDDGSTDDSWEYLKKVLPILQTGFDIVLIRLTRSVPYVSGTFSFRAGVARHIGCQHANGTAILFLDPDQSIIPGCLDEHRAQIRMGRDVSIGSRRFPGSLDYRLRMRRWQSSRIPRSGTWWKHFYTGNSAVRADVFWTAGGFDPMLQFWGLDDSDLGYRLQVIGAKAQITPRAQVLHLPGIPSGGGEVQRARAQSCLFQMEVLYRKHLDEEILRAYEPFWRRLQ